MFKISRAMLKKSGLCDPLFYVYGTNTNRPFFRKARHFDAYGQYQAYCLLYCSR